MKPQKRLLDGMAYVNSASTDIRVTFDRIRKEMAQAQKQRPDAQERGASQQAIKLRKRAA